MRVYISVDMEGVAGVVHESQTDPTNPACAAEYARFRRLMTAEANAAIEGALAAGATKLVVNDSHWFMRNLLAEELHQAAELLSGDPKPQSMVEGIDGGFAAARELLGDHVAAVVVKEAVSRHAAQSVAPAVACRMIRDGVTGALRRSHTPFVLTPPISVEVDFALTIHADMAELCPGATRTGGRTVAYTHQDYREVFRAWRAMLNLSAVV